MKYCMNCGTMLEDSAETCISCGTDVTIPENVSPYPPQILETIDAEKAEKKARMRIIILIVVIFALLVAIVIVAAIGMSNGGFTLGAGVGNSGAVDENFTEDSYYEDEYAQTEEYTDEIAEAVEEPVAEEPEEVVEEEPVPEEPVNRVVKDDMGRYFNYLVEKDDAGNDVFRAVYPEDFTQVDYSIDYSKCSTVYPISISFSAGDEEGYIRFVYMSPQQFWYKNSETGKSRSNERNLSYYMSYYTFDTPQKYIEDRLAANYPGAKLEMVSEKEVSSGAEEKMKELSEFKNKQLNGDIGDYAHIGDETTYANMDSTYSAMVYEYEITTKDKQLIFDKFYVPIISNSLYYANADSNDRGTVIEWYYLAFVAMEVGNEDMYDEYQDDFDIFVANACPTDEFMYLNQLYAKEILAAVDASRSVDPLTEEMLKEYTKELQNGVKLDDFNKKVTAALRSAGTKAFSGSTTLYAPDKVQVMFLDESTGKVFASSASDEYPGDAYEELKLTNGTSSGSETGSTSTGGDAEAGALPDDIEAENI